MERASVCALCHYFRTGNAKALKRLHNRREGAVFETRGFRRDVRVGREHGSVFLALDPDLRSEKLKAQIFGLSNTGSVLRLIIKSWTKRSPGHGLHKPALARREMYLDRTGWIGPKADGMTAPLALQPPTLVLCYERWPHGRHKRTLWRPSNTSFSRCSIAIHWSLVVPCDSRRGVLPPPQPAPACLPELPPILSAHRHASSSPLLHLQPALRFPVTCQQQTR